VSFEAVANAEDLDALEAGANGRGGDDTVDAEAGPPPTMMANRKTSYSLILLAWPQAADHRLLDRWTAGRSIQRNRLHLVDKASFCFHVCPQGAYVVQPP
jgi:hypothetical protein